MDADFQDKFERNKWLYLLFKCGMKTKTHFEWVHWHWSSHCQLNLEPTRPNSLVGCKVPTDLMKISVKEAMHMTWVFIIISHAHFPGYHTEHGHNQSLSYQGWVLHICLSNLDHYYTPHATKLLGGILVSLRMSVRTYIRPSVPHPVSAL